MSQRAGKTKRALEEASKVAISRPGRLTRVAFFSPADVRVLDYGPNGKLVIDVDPVPAKRTPWPPPHSSRGTVWTKGAKAGEWSAISCTRPGCPAAPKPGEPR